MASDESLQQTNSPESEQKALIFTGYLNAGGRGTRLSEVVESDENTGVSKALLEVGEPKKTILEHQLEWLTQHGATILVPAVGDHDTVLNLVKKMPGHRSNIYPLLSPRQLGTGGDLLFAVSQRPELFHEIIVISNVDTLVDINMKDLLKTHQQTGAVMTIALTTAKKMPNGANVPNEGAYYVDPSGKVIYSAEAVQNPITEDEAQRIVNYRGSSTGLIVADKDFLSVFPWLPQDGDLSLYRNITSKAIMEGRMAAFNNGERLFIDVGTPDTLEYAQTHPELFET